MSLTSVFRHLFHPQRSNNHRPKILHPDALFVFVLFAVGVWFARFPAAHLSTQVGQVLGFSSSITASDVVTQTNQQRTSQGLGALKVSDKLNQAAAAKAQNMLSQQYWAHVAPDGTQPWKFFRDAGYKYSVAGENLARDFSGTGDMMAAWMASPTHRKNILEGRYQEIGVAVVNGNLLGTDTTLVVQLFGTPVGGQAAIDSGGQKTIATKVAATPKPTEITIAQRSAPEPTPNLFVQSTTPTPVQPFTRQEVLAATVVQSSELQRPIFLSPLQLSKAFFLAIIFVIASTLIYDSFIMNHHNTVRLVGKNLAHLALLMVTAFLLLLFKGGVIG